MYNQILDLIASHGLLPMIFAGIGIMIALNYKTIVNYILITIQSAAIVKSHEATIKELKNEIQELRNKLEEYNELLAEQSKKYNELFIDQAATIARLEERVLHSAKSRVKDKA